jgi:hypothetical protein
MKQEKLNEFKDQLRSVEREIERLEDLREQILFRIDELELNRV